jgi:tetratricopeptide (TPR) repeat protein
MDDLGPIADILGSRADWTGGVGYALVLGAVDWRRCGISRPVPVSLLRALAASRLDAEGRANLADQRTYEAALEWATSMTSGGSLVLQPAGLNAFAVNDLVVELIRARGTAIPEDSWQVAIENASAAELLRIGSIAQAVYGKPEIAAQAWRKAVDRGDADETMEATGNLAWLLMEVMGDFAGAQAAWQRLIDSGHPDAAGVRVVLGGLLMDQGDIAGAKAAFQQAIDSGDPDAAVRAVASLGDLLMDQGDIAGAKAAFQQAINSRHYLWAPQAAVQLGKLLMMQGDIAGAKAAFQQAIDSGHAEAAADARAFLRDLPK